MYEVSIHDEVGNIEESFTVRNVSEVREIVYQLKRIVKGGGPKKLVPKPDWYMTVYVL